MGLTSSVGSALVLRIQTTSMQEGGTCFCMRPAKQKSSILPTLAYSNQTKKGDYQEKGRKKQTKRYPHQEEMSTQIKRRTLPIPDASTNKSLLFVRPRYSLTKRRKETVKNKNKKDSMRNQKTHTALPFLLVKIEEFKSKLLALVSLIVNLITARRDRRVTHD